MKRFLALMLSSLMLVSLASCGKPKDDESDREKELVLPEAAETEEKEDEKEDEKIVLDIKELGEVDEVTLDEAANALGFENEKFFHAVANAIGKDPSEMTKDDINKVHYVAVGPEGELGHTVYIGYIDYADEYFAEGDDLDAKLKKLNELVMISEFVYDKNTDTLSDLGNFKNVEVFEIYDVAIDDISFIKEYDSLIFGYFKNNGITDVSCLADYNPESLAELDLTGNDIADWTPLHHIKEKVTVFYGESDGMPIMLTLEDMLEQKELPVDITVPSENEQADSADDEASDNGDEPLFVDENGEEIDFGSLFE